MFVTTKNLIQHYLKEDLKELEEDLKELKYVFDLFHCMSLTHKNHHSVLHFRRLHHLHQYLNCGE